MYLYLYNTEWIDCSWFSYRFDSRENTINPQKKMQRDAITRAAGRGIGHSRLFVRFYCPRCVRPAGSEIKKSAVLCYGFRFWCLLNDERLEDTTDI